MTHNGREIVVEYIPFPKGVQGYVKGAVTERTTDYLILIDSTRHPQAQRHTLGHELAHIFLNHFNQPGRPVKDQEREAKRDAWHYYRQYKAEIHTLKE